MVDPNQDRIEARRYDMNGRMPASAMLLSFLRLVACAFAA